MVSIDGVGVGGVLTGRGQNTDGHRQSDEDKDKGVSTIEEGAPGRAVILNLGPAE